MVSLQILRKGRCVAICLALCAVTVFAQGSDPAGTSGRELYLSYQCWQCHGYEGQGGAAARVAAMGYPYAAFTRFVRIPNAMPAYSPEMLSDDKLRLIYDFLNSVPEPPPLADIPLLRAQ